MTIFDFTSYWEGGRGKGRFPYDMGTTNTRREVVFYGPKTKKTFVMAFPAVDMGEKILRILNYQYDKCVWNFFF